MAWRSQTCPIHTERAILRYMSHGVAGHFVEAVMANDLRTAVFRADPKNLANLGAVVQLVHETLPARAWGSPEAVEVWQAARLADKDRRNG